MDMKIVNIMNFVRQIDERAENSTAKLLDLTTEELKIVNEYNLDNTFLLQYDALCNEDFVSLFKNNATEKTELGVWYEIVAPLSEACGIPYRSRNGWKWDWNIDPGFSMSYTPDQREALIDETMRKFKEVFGYYPKTVASWLIDTHTINYLTENYDIKALAICRDQVNTDAYTLRGGYFNQAYYPSKNNMFTPAQTKDMQVSVPMFRLLGPCPIHNYDGTKYGSDEIKAQWNIHSCFTLEPGWYMGHTPHMLEWMFDTYYDQESLGFAYSQIGQENSFFMFRNSVLQGTRMQIEYLLSRGDVVFQKMCDTGEAFINRYPKETPATSVVAINNWDTADVQSIYYDCKNYSANLFRFEDKIFFRSLFLFDERIRDLYMEKTCSTFDAVYENLPIVDTLECSHEEKKHCGLMVDENGQNFTANKLSDGVLKVEFGEKNVIFFDDRIEITTDKLTLYENNKNVTVSYDDNGLIFEYKGHNYRLDIDNGTVGIYNGYIEIKATSDKIILHPKKA